MKICLLGYQEKFFWSGSATLKVQKNVHKYLNLNSIETHLFICSNDKKIFSVLFDSLNFINSPDGKIISGGVVPFLFHLKQEKYDLLHMIIVRNYMIFIALFSFILNFRHCVTFHDTLTFPHLKKCNYQSLKSFFVNWTIAKTSQLIFLFNDEDVKIFNSKFPNIKTAIVRNGVEEELFDHSNLLQTRKNILFAGGKNRSYKGYEFLVSALQKTKSKFDLLLCGFSEAKNLDEKNLGELTPQQFKEQLRKIIALVIPSEYDSFNISALEAMASGTPIIISNRCGVTKYLKDSEGCFIVNYGDVENLAEKIDLLVQNSELWSKVSKEAPITAKRFMWSETILDYKNIYVSLIQ